MHTGKELEVHEVEKGRLSCNSDAPQVGRAWSDSVKVIKVNGRKMNHHKTKPYSVIISEFLLHMMYS
jgi:hypothetical protein